MKAGSLSDKMTDRKRDNQIYEQVDGRIEIQKDRKMDRRDDKTIGTCNPLMVSGLTYHRS